VVVDELVVRDDPVELAQPRVSALPLLCDCEVPVAPPTPLLVPLDVPLPVVVPAEPPTEDDVPDPVVLPLVDVLPLLAELAAPLDVAVPVVPLVPALVPLLVVPPKLIELLSESTVFQLLPSLLLAPSETVAPAVLPTDTFSDPPVDALSPHV